MTWVSIGEAVIGVIEEVCEMYEAPEVVQKFAAHVKLKKNGKIWVGKSPFCEEKTGSFCVNPSTQRFHCFASGLDGTYDDFIQMVGLRLQ